MNDLDHPHGFVLSEAALYSFKCQDVYPDIVSFAAAIPEHLRPLFLIPIKVDRIIASFRDAGGTDGPTDTGDTEEAELFGTKTIVNYDNEPNLTSKDPGSVFDMGGADERTHHQEYDYDQNVQSPTETSYMEDVDTTNYPYGPYPYRTEETPVRHSSIALPPVLLLRIAVKPEQLEVRAPKKIRENAKTCSVTLTSYDKRTRVFTFSVNCGHGSKSVQASLSDVDQVAVSCNCPFWRWNGPEFHAKENAFMLGQPYGTASPPNVRDRDRKYWLCKHAYSVLRRLDTFVAQIVEENWEMDDQELLKQIDEEWDRLEGTARIPLEETEEGDVDVELEPEEGSEEKELEEPEAEEQAPSMEPGLEPEAEEQAPAEEPEAQEAPYDYEAQEPEEELEEPPAEEPEEEELEEIEDYEVLEEEEAPKPPRPPPRR